MRSLVSILMPSYNYDWCINEAIESVIKQLYTNWELIIVDDGSKDNSVKVIKKYLGDKRIKLIVHKKNKGLAGAYQTGLKKAKGEFIAFLEADDIWLPDSLDVKVKVLEKSKCALAYTDVKLFGTKGFSILSKKIESLRRKKTVLYMKPFLLNDEIKFNLIYTFSCVIIRKKALKKLDFDVPSVFPESLDWWLWIQVYLNQMKIIFIPKKLTLWRMHNESYNSKNIISNPEYLKKVDLFYQILHKKVTVSRLSMNIKKEVLEIIRTQQKKIRNAHRTIIKIESFLKILPSNLIERGIYGMWIFLQIFIIAFSWRKNK